MQAKRRATSGMIFAIALLGCVSPLLAKKACFSVVVLNESDHAGVSGLAVAISANGSAQFKEGTTNSNGQYDFGCMALDTYSLKISDDSGRTWFDDPSVQSDECPITIICNPSYPSCTKEPPTTCWYCDDCGY